MQKQAIKIMDFGGLLHEEEKADVNVDCLWTVIFFTMRILRNINRCLKKS